MGRTGDVDSAVQQGAEPPPGKEASVARGSVKGTAFVLAYRTPRIICLLFKVALKSRNFLKKRKMWL